MSDGMAGMVHANDVRIAEGLRDIELPADPARRWRRGTARSTTRSSRWHRAAGADIPDLNELDGAGLERADVLPVLPALLRAADVQQRVVVPVPTARARRRR